MRMGQGVRTGLGHRAITCVLQTQLSSFCSEIICSGILYSLVHPCICPLYTGRLFHCYILDKSICHFKGVRSILSLLF